MRISSWWCLCWDVFKISSRQTSEKLCSYFPAAFFSQFKASPALLTVTASLKRFLELFIDLSSAIEPHCQLVNFDICKVYSTNHRFDSCASFSTFFLSELPSKMPLSLEDKLEFALICLQATSTKVSIPSKRTGCMTDPVPTAGHEHRRSEAGHQRRCSVRDLPKISVIM